MKQLIGVDIGGSGIKGAPVDLDQGKLVTDRVRIPTPEGAPPQPVAEVVAQVVRDFDVDGPIGCTFPAVVTDGVARTAANVDPTWIGIDVHALLQLECDREFIVVNDADAAGLAEMRFGAGRGHTGVVVMLTLGTGIGSAVFLDGQLLPNTEFGHLEIRGKAAETRASDRAREERDLGWHRWANRLNEVLARIEALLWPDLFIIGGGVSKKSEHFIHLLSANADIVPAALLNDAGIVGAALAAAEAR
jgi:polyphosphate glucokinase